MPIVIVPKHVLLSGAYPPELNGFIDAAIWNQLRLNFDACESSSNMIALAGECGVCLISGLFCVFCFHPCIAEFIVKDRARQVCNDANKSYYSGNLVFSCSTDGAIIVNTDNIANATYISPVAATATMIVPAPRLMNIQVPAGVPPGSSLTVQTPDGAQVVVVVPANAQPGSLIQVQY